MAEETKKAIEELTKIAEQNPIAKAFMDGLTKGMTIQKAEKEES